MLATPFNEFGLIIDSIGVDGTRPTTPQGVTPTVGASNVYGAYTTIIAGASVTSDVYGILINFNGVGQNGVLTDTIATIGLDAAGGTSFTNYIVDLLASASAPYNGAGYLGVEYFFPIFIKAGTSIGVKMAQNNAAPAGATRAFVRLFCQPSRLDLWKYGSAVRTYGNTPASSSGTAVTIGTTTDPAYTLLGTIAAGDNPWFWQLGTGLNNATVGAQDMIHADLAIGDGTNFKQAITNHRIVVNTNEQVSMFVNREGYRQAKAGDGVYARGMGSGTAPAGMSFAAYGVV